MAFLGEKNTFGRLNISSQPEYAVIYSSDRGQLTYAAQVGTTAVNHSKVGAENRAFWLHSIKVHSTVS